MAKRSGRKRIASAMTVLPLAVLIVSFAATAALANGGSGGRGNLFGDGAGGVDTATGAGGSGGTASSVNTAAGGGGGAGATGGNGGNGAGGVNGGQGGQTAGAAGQAGGNASAVSAGAGGGGGGAHGFVGAALPGAATGGDGSKGGDSQGFFSGNGGGGGAGGFGAVVTGSGDLGILNANVAGGNGGNGGSVTGGNTTSQGGSAGTGGAGLFFTDAATFTIGNGVTVQGGNGGTGGNAPQNFNRGFAGAGGAGIVGAGLSIDNQGTISGGFAAGGGGSQAYGIVFTGGVNSVSGVGAIDGGINVQGGSFAPALPSSAVGTPLAINGPLRFANGTFYNVRVTPTASDSATVAGAANLAGAGVNAQFSAGSYIARQYTILTATGGLGGTQFTGVSGNLAGLAASLAYQGNDVLLLLSAQLGLSGHLTVNQQNTATALNNFFNAGGTLPPGFATLFGLTGDTLLGALNQVSGEAGASIASATFMAWNQFFNMVFDPFAQNRGGFGGTSAFAPEAGRQTDDVRLAYAAVTPRGALKGGLLAKAPPSASPLAPRWRVWGGGYGGSARTDGDAALGSHDITSRAYGFAVGADHRLATDGLIGFALAGGGTSFGLNQGLGGGSSELFQVSVYARQNWNAAYLMGAFGYGWQDITLDRTVTVAGIDRLEADFDAHTFAGRVEGGWRFGGSYSGVTPYAAVQVVSLDLPGYTENAASGASTFALTYAGRTDTQTRSELGARFDHVVPLDNAVFTLRGRTAWAHDYDNGRFANATFQALPGATFMVNGAAPDADSVLVAGGAELALRNGFSIAASFEGEFSGNSKSYAGHGSVRYRW